MDITLLLKGFEFQAVIIATFAVATIPLLVRANRSLQDPVASQKKVGWITLSLFFWIITITGFWLLGTKLTAVPMVTAVSPRAGGAFNPLAPAITLQFSAPIKYETLAVHTYPETDVFVQPKGYLANLFSYGTKLTLTPRTTLPPGQQYMVYVSNIEGPLTRGYGGERLLELTNPDIHIAKTTVNDGAADVATSEKIIITLDRPMVSGREWSVRMDPHHAMRVTATDSQTLEVIPQTPLHQGTTYTLTLIQTPILLVQSTQEEMTRLEERVIGKMHFTTVKPAFLSSINTQGNIFNPSSPFHLVFDQPMDRTSVEKNITLEPPVSLGYVWESNNTKLALHHPTLAKDTAYSLTLRSEIQTALGGKMESDVTFPFRTAGPLTLVSLSPAANATEVAPTAIVTATFNQNIPQSASEYFSITPPVAGRISILNNTLEFKPDKPLSRETGYTITLAASMPSSYGQPLGTTVSASFTTVPAEVILDVPFFRQESNFTCNIAAARMLLAYRNIQRSEKDLIHTIGLGGKRGSGNPSTGYIDDYGTYWPAVLRGITAHRPARVITSGSLTDILNEIDTGNPVMTWGQNGWSDPHEISWTATDGTFIKAINGMHSTVVRGYRGSVENPTLIYVNDPWRGQYTLEPNEFMRRWKYVGMALVID